MLGARVFLALWLSALQQRTESRLHADQVSSNAHIAELVRNAWDASSFFIPSSWSAAVPRPLSTVQLARRWGYPVESQLVETLDGHMLLVHRLPASRPSPVVILVHGLLCSSADWVVAGPNRSLGLLLHDAGYDVWLANLRGNMYAMSHRYLTTQQATFWNFSFHEHGVLDLAAILDKVVSRAPASSPLTVVTHSMGAAALLALLSERPQYNRLLRHAVLLGPAASLRGVTPIFVRILAHYGAVIGRVLEALGSLRVLTLGSVTVRVLSLVCHPDAPTAELCKLAVFAVVGHSQDLYDPELLPQIFMQCSAGASVRTLVHLSECLVAGDFRKLGKEYSDGADQDEYDLSAVTVPTTIVYAWNDLLSGPEEARWLQAKLGNDTSGLYEVPHPTFNHMDFLYATDTRTHLYDFILTDMAKHVHVQRGRGQGDTVTPHGSEATSEAPSAHDGRCPDEM